MYSETYLTALKMERMQIKLPQDNGFCYEPGWRILVASTAAEVGKPAPFTLRGQGLRGYLTISKNASSLNTQVTRDLPGYVEAASAGSNLNIYWDELVKARQHYVSPSSFETYQIKAKELGNVLCVNKWARSRRRSPV